MATTSAPKKSIAQRWADLPPKRRQQIAFAGVIVGVIAISFAMLQGSGNTGRRAPDTSRLDAQQKNGLLPDANLRDIGMSGVAKDIEAGREANQTLAERVSRMEETMRDYRGNLQAGGAARSQNDALLQQMQVLQEKVNQLETSGPAGNRPQPGAPAAPMIPEEVSPPGYGGIRSIGDAPGNKPTRSGGAPTAVPVSETSAGSAPSAGTPGDGKSAAARPRAGGSYLPSGSIIQGVMLTGMDAPTGKGAMKDPVPVLVRIQKEAILPNRYRADVRECFALVSGQGDLASERAYLRSETISCVRKDGGVIDMQMNAYVVDSDGKAGLRGRLVSKQGSVLSKAILASFADGVSQAFKGRSPQLNFGGTGDVDYGNAAQAGITNGVSSSLDRVSKYYLDLADQLFPILEIDAGRPLTLVLVKGLEMTSVH